MKRGLLIFWCALLALYPVPDAWAQGAGAPPAVWDAVRQMPAGEKLQVQTKQGNKVTGQVVSASDAELWLEQKQQVRAIARDEISKVWRIAPPSRSKQQFYSGIGVGVGLIAGLALAVSQIDVQCGECSGTKVGLTAAIIGFPVGGAIAGRALARGKRILIYYAP